MLISKNLTHGKFNKQLADTFISFIDNEEERFMHSKRDNIEIIMNDKADETKENVFNSLKNRYQSNLESMKNSEFILKDNKCFQYAVTVALNYKETKKDLQRITKTKPFINND